MMSNKHSANLFPALWALGTVGALTVTLRSLRNDDFDGLNNFLQLPFALPWGMLPTAIVTTHYQDAWVLAAMGLLNAFLLHVRLGRRRTEPS